MVNSTERRQWLNQPKLSRCAHQTAINYTLQSLLITMHYHSVSNKSLISKFEQKMLLWKNHTRSSMFLYIRSISITQRPNIWNLSIKSVHVMQTNWRSPHLTMCPIFDSPNTCEKLMTHLVLVLAKSITQPRDWRGYQRGCKPKIGWHSS